MADIVLSNGKEFTFDLNAFTMGEWRTLFVPENGKDIDTEVMELMSRSCGVTVEELLALGYQDARRVNKAFFDKVRQPIGADPN
jgi:hypothetical protein